MAIKTSYTIGPAKDGNYEFFWRGNDATDYYIDPNAGNIIRSWKTGNKTDYWVSGYDIHGPDGNTGYYIVEYDTKVVHGPNDYMPWED